MQSCDLNSFVPDIDLPSFDDKTQSKINMIMNYYNCLDKNSRFYMNPQYFSNSSYFLRLGLNLKNNVNKAAALNYLSTQNPMISLIFQDYLINSETKFKPYSSLIGEFTNYVGFYFSKIVNVKINPFNILDDTNPLAQGSFKAPNVPEYSGQLDQTIMLVQRQADFIKYFPNRESFDYQNLNLIQFDITLGNMLTSTLRTYRKFNDFVAGVSSIISNVFIIFTIITQKLNKLKGINNMVKSSFSLNKASNLQTLKLKFQDLFENFQSKKKNVKKIPKMRKKKKI